MKNLLEETKEILKENGKSPKDVWWIGNEEFRFSWTDFVQLANKEYDGGYGSSEVYEGLKVVGEGWWLERGEYDGSEWWEYKEQPKRPKTRKVPSTLFNENYSFSGFKA